MKTGWIRYSIGVLGITMASSGLMALGLTDGTEFGGRCAMGMAQGQEFQTDCSVIWSSADGKKYCFGNEASREQFLENPDYNRVRAADFASLNEIQRVGKRMERMRKKDVKAFLTGVITQRSAANDGFFPVYDSLTKTKLDLVFEEIQFMRTLHGYGFFPDVVFHDKDDAQKKYWVDFWLRPTATGKVEIFDTRIYKGPRRGDDGWQLVTRQPPPWWWIPASEHPGETESKRGWEVMSAIEEFVIDETVSNGGIFRLKHPETGEEIGLEYIGIHQPVRRLDKDGRFFACSDFREVGTDDLYYDVDFWLNDSNGEIEVGEVRVHKIPKLLEGNWVQVPKYDFEGVDYEVVP